MVAGGGSRGYAGGMDATPKRLERTHAYIREVFGQVDRHDRDGSLATLMDRAIEAGMPDIAVSPEVGRLLRMYTAAATQGRDAVGRVLEIGTLGGYSGIWIAHALPYGGRLYTIESDDAHQDFARREFERAGVSSRVELVSGRALDVLPRLCEEFGAGGLDMAFLDADKREYVEYARLVKPALRVGGFLVADNCLGSAKWWIDDAKGSSPERDTVDEFNRAMVRDGDFITTVNPMREGVLIALKLR